jgi:hypothetical protein
MVPVPMKQGKWSIDESECCERTAYAELDCGNIGNAGFRISSLGCLPASDGSGVEASTRKSDLRRFHDIPVTAERRNNARRR